MAALVATPFGTAGFTQPLGLIRSLTEDFLHARAHTRRLPDHSEASDSEDVRWVSTSVSVYVCGEDQTSFSHKNSVQ